ncbi:MAG: (S)-2-haloacid dehalogenase 4A [Candidatus Heimdallarchaeota archaeon LC_2]|nr:MAG: (S)-2-haloacid dehalogenase 4A [Candidatus Heimdallarchaeota archaeon LC_2]
MSQRNLFIDLHGVLVRTPLIFDEYRRITVEHLVNHFSLKQETAEERYDHALKSWEKTAFEYLRNPMTNKIGKEFLDFLENCDKLFPKFLYEDLDISSASKDLRTRPFEYSVAVQVQALYPEVDRTLKILKSHGYKMYIASSSHSSHIRGIIEANDLDKYIEGFFGFDTLAATKHTLKYYKAMVDQINSTPKDCVMIGNSMHEILKPRKIRMMTIHINRERKVPTDVRKLANLSLENLSSLPEHLDIL